MVIDRAISCGAVPISFFIESTALGNEDVQYVLEKVDDNIIVYEAELPVINKITGFNLTRGMLALFQRPKLPRVEDILSSRKKIAVLEDIVNPTNVGAIFRSAAALGAEGIILTPATTDPFYRRSARVSMGTVFMIPWAYTAKEADINDLLHEYNYTVISMALANDAKELTEPALAESEKRAVIFGSEGDGISKETLRKSDYVVMIPMLNGVDSLNVAAASAVTFWELFRK